MDLVFKIVTENHRNTEIIFLTFNRGLNPAKKIQNQLINIDMPQQRFGQYFQTHLIMYGYGQLYLVVQCANVG